MSGSEANGDKCKFKWGTQRRAGRYAEQPAYYYDSFTYDGIEYFLYDSVYLHAADEPEPYIGKLLRAWEHGDPTTRKIKVLWFFRPVELHNWLGDRPPLKNELFLASGEGIGLVNINPLEALVGKCNVICTSKDKRNPPPSEKELKKADYIFYRVFDVSNYTISERIGDKIGGVEVKLLFNRRGDRRTSPLLKVAANGEVEMRCITAVSDVVAVENRTEENAVSFLKDGKLDSEGKALQKESTEEILSVKPQQGPLEDLSMKHLSITGGKQNDVDINSVGNSIRMVNLEDSQDETKTVKRPRVLSSQNAGDAGEEAHNKTFAGDIGSLENSISKKMKLDDSSIRLSEPSSKLSLDKENIEVIIEKAKSDLNKDEKKTTDHVSEDKVQVITVKCSNNKDKIVSKSVKLNEPISTEKLKLKKPSTHASEEARTGKDSNLKDTIVSKLVKPHEQKMVSSEESPKVPPAKSFDRANKIDDRDVEATRRPDSDRSKWFKGLPWEERLRKAQEHGTLVFLGNLDPSYISVDVEDIIWHGFRENCTAKVVQHSSFSSPHYSQAFVIFKTREAADLVTKKLNEGCLMLPNGRPLVASRRSPFLKETSTKFVGHLSIDKLRVFNKEEWKRAVSTSHCSQPNTIECEMALEWKLLHERFNLYRMELYKQHAEELNSLKSQLKRK